MSSTTSALLVRLAPDPAEGLPAYLLRVVLANGVAGTCGIFRRSGRRACDLKALGPMLPVVLATFPSSLLAECQSPSLTAARTWNLRRARFCPICLARDGIWKREWDLTLVACCPEHRIVLSDRCHVCKKSLTWARARLTRCDCGANLKETPTEVDAGSERSVAAWLHALLGGDDLPAPFAGLTLEQLSTLGVVLGSYSANRDLKKPLRSAVVTTVHGAAIVAGHAATLLDDWPHGFERFLSAIPRSGSRSTEASRQFGPLYDALFEQLASQAFDFVRAAFFSHLKQTWQRPVTGRHRRLVDGMHGHDWVSVGALNECGVKPALLRRIAQANPLAMSEVQHRWRNRTAFSKSTVLESARRYENGLTLAQAATRLGIPRKRVRQMSEDGFLDVLPRSSPRQPWVISLQSIVAWQTMTCLSANPSTGNAQTVRTQLRKLLSSHGAWKSFLSHVRERRLTVCHPDGHASRFGDCLIDAEALKLLLGEENEECVEWLSVPDAARELKVKDEVCYHLVQKQLLMSQIGVLRNRQCRIVHRSAINAFRADFTSLRDAADLACTTPRALLTLIRTRGIKPVCGPDVDGCRQYFLRRSDWGRWTRHLIETGDCTS